MQETFSVFFQLFFTFILFLFPFHFLKNNFIFLTNLNFYDLICLNIITQFTLYLTLSFFFPNISLLIIFFFFISIILIIFFFTKKKIILKKNYFLILSIFLFLIIAISIFFFIANNFRLQWDAIAHWFWKVQNFYQGGNLENFKNLPYPFYPHLGTYLWANFLHISFLNYEYFGRLYYAFIYLSVIFSILYSIKPKYFIIITCVISYLIFDIFLLGGYQEFLIFFFITFISRLFYLLIEKKITINIFLKIFLLSLNLLIWTKQEGVIYALILFFVFIYSFNSNFNKKLISTFFLLFSIFIYFYFNIVYKQTSLFHEPIINDFKRLTDLKLFLESFLFITLHLLKGLIQRPVIIISFILYFLVKLRKNETIFKLDFINLFFILNILLIYGVFFQTQYPLEGMVPQMLGRLLLQTSGFYLLNFIYYFNFKSKYEK